MARLSRKRLTAILLAAALLVTGAIMLDPMSASASASVKIGQATSTETGGIRGGKAGDQTGGEVGIGKWTYSSKSGAYNNWKYVIRAKDPALAKKLADSMKKACLNNHIGYDQKAPDRFSCYDEAKAVGWDLSKIKNDCETTCASIISVCLNGAGINVGRYWDSSMVYNDLKQTGKFNIFSSSEFTASPNLLEPGDILLSDFDLPLVLDDVFVYFDDERLARTLTVISSHEGQKIILSCQNREENILSQLGIEYKMIYL